MGEETATKYFTLEEIARNNGKDTDRTWIIVKDNVYDVTDYLDDHPGGGDLITEWAGMDSTKEFDSAGHSGDAKKDLKKYKIGEVVEADRKKPKKPEKKIKTDNNVKSNVNRFPTRVRLTDLVQIQTVFPIKVSAGFRGDLSTD